MTEGIIAVVTIVVAVGFCLWRIFRRDKKRSVKSMTQLRDLYNNDTIVDIYADGIGNDTLGLMYAYYGGYVRYRGRVFGPSDNLRIENDKLVLDHPTYVAIGDWCGIKYEDGWLIANFKCMTRNIEFTRARKPDGSIPCKKKCLFVVGG